MHTPRAVRAARNAKRKEYLNLKCDMKHPSSLLSSSPCTSQAVTPASSDDTYIGGIPMCALVGGALFSAYNVHELPQESEDSIPSSSAEMSEAAPPSSDISVLVSAALVARVESIESESVHWHLSWPPRNPASFALKKSHTVTH